MIRTVPGTAWLALGLLGATATACQTPTRAEADVAVSRTPKSNPHDRPEQRRKLQPHRAVDVEPTAAILTARLAESLPGSLSTLVRLETVAPSPAQVDAYLTAVEAQARALGLTATRPTPLTTEITLPSEPPGATASVAFLTHGDVLPAGPGWTTAPFSGLIQDGAVHGRGTQDGKGPTVAALAAMAAMAGTRLARPFETRLIVGMARHAGFECTQGYLRARPAPDFTMALDGPFPVVTGEKGQATVKLVQRRTPSPAPQGCALDAWTADGDGATATLRCAPGRAADVATALADSGGVRATHSENNVAVEAPGAAGGDNLVRALFAAPLDGDASGTQLSRVLEQLVLRDPTGERLGLTPHGRFTPNTVQLTRLSAAGSLWVATLTVRFAPPQTVQDVLGLFNNAVTRMARQSGQPPTVLVDGDGRPPFLVDPLRPQVAALLRAYTTVMAQDAQPVTLSTTTLAKAWPNSVGFGPLFPDQPDLRARPNEHLTTQALFQLARVYAAALMELAGHPTTREDYRDTNPR